MRTYTVAELEAMRTLHPGHFDDLKVETMHERVWLSRLEPEDGEIYQIHHEECIDHHWTITREYAPFNKVTP